MTVTTEVSRATFPWTGAETSFACGFPADDVSHLRVFFRTNAGVTTQMTLGVNYNATLASGSKLATVTPVSFPASSGTVIVRRLTPAQVAEVLADGQEYSLAVIQALHDKAAMRSAEDRSTLSRAIVLAEGDELGNGDFDLGGSGIANLAPGTSSTHAATVGQIQAILAGSGNVPAPVIGDVNRFLVATGEDAFGWLALALAMIPDGLFTADAAGRAKFADKIWTLAKLQDISQFEVLGRVAAGDGPVQRLTAAQQRQAAGLIWHPVDLQTVTGSAVQAIDIALGSYKLYRFTALIIPNTAATDFSLGWRASQDNGVSFASGASAYMRQARAQSGNSQTLVAAGNLNIGYLTSQIETSLADLPAIVTGTFYRGATGRNARMHSGAIHYDSTAYAMSEYHSQFQTTGEISHIRFLGDQANALGVGSIIAVEGCG